MDILNFRITDIFPYDSAVFLRSLKLNPPPLPPLTVLFRFSYARGKSSFSSFDRHFRCTPSGHFKTFPMGTHQHLELMDLRVYSDLCSLLALVAVTCSNPVRAHYITPKYHGRAPRLLPHLGYSPPIFSGYSTVRLKCSDTHPLALQPQTVVRFPGEAPSVLYLRTGPNSSGDVSPIP